MLPRAQMDIPTMVALDLRPLLLLGIDLSLLSLSFFLSFWIRQVIRQSARAVCIEYAASSNDSWHRTSEKIKMFICVLSSTQIGVID